MTLAACKFIVRLSLCVTMLSTARAQGPSNGSSPPADTDSSFLHSLSIGIRGHFGTFMANLPKLQYVQDGYTMLGELDIVSQTNGRKSWQQSTNYPELGIGFLYGQSGASVYIGHIAAILPFINFHLFEKGPVSLNWRMGVGPAWIQKAFNPKTDYQNFVIGSHLNACINLLLSTEIRLLPRTSLDLGFSFTHISNGSMALPNLGLNTPALSAGFRYDLYPRQKRIRHTLPPIKKKTNFYLYSFVAAKQSLPLESATYLVNVFAVEALHDISRTSRLGGGINMTLDRANNRQIPNSPEFAFDRSKSHWQASLYAAYEYVVGNLSFPLQVGYYLYNNYPVNSIYEYMGVKYSFALHWSAGFALKAHLGNGDFLQWGLGYKF
ncbi:MAG TPA: acyloxyacyl hydrolase [Puia sp.]